MSPDTQQLVSLYESVNGEVSLEDLAEGLNNRLSVEAIKIALMNGSALYREKAKTSKDLFTEEDAENSAKVIKQLMYAAESDYVKLRAAIRVQDHVTGRLDVKNVRNIKVSVTTINQELRIASEAIKKAKVKVIEIDPRHKHLMSVES